MTKFTRDYFITQTCGLLGRVDQNCVTLAEILDRCGARKGSLYHFFPRGKDELVVAAVGRLAGAAADDLRRHCERSGSTAEGVYRHVMAIAKWIDGPSASRSIPFSAVATLSGGEDGPVRQACLEALALLEQVNVERLLADGLGARAARDLARFVVSAVEGAFLVARTNRSGDSLRSAARNLRRVIGSRVSDQD